MLRRLLSLPLLLPLLAVLLLGALNPRPSLSLRLLTWRTPSLPLGAWLALAGVGGAGLSGAATALALAGSPRPLRRRVHRQPWPDEAVPPRWDTDQPAAASGVWRDAGPSRAPGEPAPTVEVPFRVIRRAHASSAGESPRAGRSAPAAAPPRPQDDDWDTPASDSW